jgi:hypothetical protein
LQLRLIHSTNGDPEGPSSSLQSRVSPTPPNLQALEEIEHRGIPGLLEVLREESLEIPPL